MSEIISLLVTLLWSFIVLQMQQSLKNAEKQGNVLDSQANLNNMNALFGETRNNFLKSSEPYWASNAEFDNLAKKIQNDIALPICLLSYFVTLRCFHSRNVN